VIKKQQLTVQAQYVVTKKFHRGKKGKRKTKNVRETEEGVHLNGEIIYRIKKKRLRDTRVPTVGW